MSSEKMFCWVKYLTLNYCYVDDINESQIKFKKPFSMKKINA